MSTDISEKREAMKGTSQIKKIPIKNLFKHSTFQSKKLGEIYTQGKERSAKCLCAGIKYILAYVHVSALANIFAHMTVLTGKRMLTLRRVIPFLCSTKSLMYQQSKRMEL